ncbi:MAG: aminoglycoside phosphotransferase family protein [Chloroflexota bacterium]|nr:aminoglycoside phosphotransferase family protein [Chloroflexota bacterium]
MLEDPGLDQRELAAALRAGFGTEASGFTFVPGFDMQAASYEVASTDGQWFAKVRFGPVADAPLEVPRALLDAGVTNVLAPIRSLSSTLWHPMADGRTLVVYPFVAGRNAMDAGMTAGQWRTFGTALRAVHDSGLEDRFADRLPAETFALPCAAMVRSVLAQEPSLDSAAARRLRAVLIEQRRRIGQMVERAEELGARLSAKPFVRVLCHADIHAANLLVADDGRIFLVGWDGPMLAPRERDLLFVIGGGITRKVTPQEEAWFFETYGEVEPDLEAIVYYRYERLLEDIGEIGRSVFSEAAVQETSRESEVRLLERFFEPGGSVESVEEV